MVKDLDHAFGTWSQKGEHTVDLTITGKRGSFSIDVDYPCSLDSKDLLPGTKLTFCDDNPLTPNMIQGYFDGNDLCFHTPGGSPEAETWGQTTPFVVALYAGAMPAAQSDPPAIGGVPTKMSHTEWLTAREKDKALSLVVIPIRR